MIIGPGNTALLAMDFQPSILQTLNDTEALLRKVAEAVAGTRSAGAKVATVRVAFTSEQLAAFPPHSAMGQRMRALPDKVAVDALPTQVVLEVGAQEGDISVRKVRVGPFRTTDLDQKLRGAGVDTVVFAGIHTSGCVLTGVREAYDLDYRIVVLADACADPDPEVHSFLITKILPKQAEVMSTTEYLETIASA